VEVPVLDGRRILNFEAPLSMQGLLAWEHVFPNLRPHGLRAPHGTSCAERY
jgi:hypothetical protein